MPSRLRGLTAAVIGGAVLSLFLAATAAAHVEPDPPAVPAGTKATIGFSVEHGCGDSGITELQIQLPAGVTGAAPVAPAGWPGSVAGDVVTFTGGPQPPHEALLVSITMQVPNTPGTALAFPVVETCQQGEVRWVPGDSEHPAPTVQLTQGPPTQEQLAPHDASGHDQHGAAAPSSSVAGPAATSTTVGAQAPDPKPTSGSSDATPIVVGVVIAVVVVGGSLAAVVIRKRRSGDQPS